jgi:hypothetical protein
MSEFSDANVEKQEGSNDEESKEESKQHICTTPTCQNVATLACPTCIKLGLDPCRFCVSDCPNNINVIDRYLSRIWIN